MASAALGEGPAQSTSGSSKLCNLVKATRSGSAPANASRVHLRLPSMPRPFEPADGRAVLPVGADQVSGSDCAEDGKLQCLGGEPRRLRQLGEKLGNSWNGRAAWCLTSRIEPFSGSAF